jgi:ParB family chromosome partitioning protein
MRHDIHYVDQLARPAGTPVGRLLPVEDIDPNPHQPRQALGDLSELTASVREKGILEPILVRQVNGRFQLIAGERRYRAAIDAGLDEIPCIVREGVSDAELMELALVENLQRQDLSPFEEADGLKVLAQTYGYTHEMLAERLGKSRPSITESLSVAAIPEDVRQLCRLADINSKSLLLQVVRQSEPSKMVALIERLQREGTTRRTARRIAGDRRKPGRGRPKHYVFEYQPKDKAFSLAIRFRKGQVPREELIRALQSILESLAEE